MRYRQASFLFYNLRNTLSPRLLLVYDKTFIVYRNISLQTFVHRSLFLVSAERRGVILLVVNFINIKRTIFLYKRRFGSFYYVHVTRKKLP